MHEIDVVRFIGVNKHFWILEALLPTFIIEWKAIFHLGVSENKLVINFPSKFTDPLKSVLGPQVENDWSKSKC